MPHRSATTMTSGVALMKCAAVLLALASGAPRAEGLSCSSASSCMARHMLDNTMLLEDLIFSSHRWPGLSRHGHYAKHHGDHHGHGRGNTKRHSHEYAGVSKHTPSASPSTLSPASAPVPAPTPTPAATTAATAAAEARAPASAAPAPAPASTPNTFYISERTTAPAFQVRELEERYELEVELPGVIEDTIELSVVPASRHSLNTRTRVLSLTAERSPAAGGHKRPPYARAWELAADVDDSSSFDASYSGDGLLIVSAPKLPAVEPATVPVRVRKDAKIERTLPAVPAVSTIRDAELSESDDGPSKLVADEVAAEVVAEAEALDTVNTDTDSTVVEALDTEATPGTTQVGTTQDEATQEGDDDARELAETMEGLDSLLSLEAKVQELKAQAQARLDARTTRAETRRQARKGAREVIGKRSAAEFAVEVEAASAADRAAAATAAAVAASSLSEDELDLDADTEAIAAAARPSHPGQPI